MKALGYDEVARVCLAHSFNTHSLDGYIGEFDVSKDELTIIRTELDKIVFDDYDLLIQLCDCLGGTDSVVDIEERMQDVKKRYGSYPKSKWDKNIQLKLYFEKKIGQDIYTVCQKETYVPEEL